MQESTGCKSWCTAMLQFRHASHLRHATVWTPPDPPRAPPAQKPTRIRRPDWLRRKHSHPGVRQVNRAASQRSCLRSGQAPHVQKPVHMHWSGWLRRKSHVSGMAGQPSSLTARSSLRTGGQADGDGRDLLRVQAGDLVGDARRAQVPEAQRAVKVAADGQAAVQAHAHAVHAGVAHQRALAEAARQVPDLCTGGEGLGRGGVSNAGCSRGSWHLPAAQSVSPASRPQARLVLRHTTDQLPARWHTAARSRPLPTEHLVCDGELNS